MCISTIEFYTIAFLTKVQRLFEFRQKILRIQGARSYLQINPLFGEKAKEFFFERSRDRTKVRVQKLPGEKLCGRFKFHNQLIGEK